MYSHCMLFFLLFGGTEEEASMLRFFIDEPSYVDLHWVRCLNLVLLLDIIIIKAFIISKCASTVRSFF